MGNTTSNEFELLLLDQSRDDDLDHAVCMCSADVALCGKRFDNTDLEEIEFTGDDANDCVVCDDIDVCPRCGHDFS